MNRKGKGRGSSAMLCGSGLNSTHGQLPATGCQCSSWSRRPCWCPAHKASQCANVPAASPPPSCDITVHALHPHPHPPWVRDSHSTSVVGYRDECNVSPLKLLVATPLEMLRGSLAMCPRTSVENFDFSTTCPAFAEGFGGPYPRHLAG